MCQLLLGYLGDQKLKDFAAKLFLSMNYWCKVIQIIDLNLIYCQIIKNVDFVQKDAGSV